MTQYLPKVIKALDTVKRQQERLLHAVEQLSGAHTAFITNGSGSRLQLESARRFLISLSKGIDAAIQDIDTALRNAPPVKRDHLQVHDGGRRPEAAPQPDPAPPPRAA